MSVTVDHVAELRQVLAEIMPAHRAEFGSADSWEALYSFQKTLARHGWTAPAWSVELGGKGLSIDEKLACDAEFSKAGAPHQVSVYGVNNVGPTIAAAGTPEQKKHLTSIVNATELWCQGFSEPDNGSDLGGLRCRAELDGDTFVINGQKVWTSIGMHATHCMLLVRTDANAPKHKGISALLVPLDSPGVSRRPIKQINGKAEFAEMFFEDVRVPVSALLGPMNEGWRVTMTTLEYERSGVISLAAKLASAVSELVTPERLVAADPVMRQRLMSLYSRSRILGWMGEKVLAETKNGMASGTASSVIKLMWSLLGRDLGEARLDMSGLKAIAGGDDHACAEFLSSRASTIAGGTTEIMKNLIGERALGLPREPS